MTISPYLKYWMIDEIDVVDLPLDAPKGLALARFLLRRLLLLLMLLLTLGRGEAGDHSGGLNDGRHLDQFWCRYWRR